MFGALSMRIFLAHKLHLVRMLENKLVGLGMQAAEAAAYVGYKVPFPVMGCCPVRALGEGGEIAAMNFCVVSSLSVCSFLAVSDKFDKVCLMLVIRFSNLLIIGQRVPLVPSRHS